MLLLVLNLEGSQDRKEVHAQVSNLSLELGIII